MNRPEAEIEFTASELANKGAYATITRMSVENNGAPPVYKITSDLRPLDIVPLPELSNPDIGEITPAERSQIIAQLQSEISPNAAVHDYLKSLITTGHKYHGIWNDITLDDGTNLLYDTETRTIVTFGDWQLYDLHSSQELAKHDAQ